MARRRDDDLTALVGRIRRFFACWLTLIASLAAALVVVGALLELFARAAFPADLEAGRLGVHPIVLSFYWAYAAMVAGVVFGAPFVLLRRYVLRPDFPFLRPGYLAVVVSPFALCALAWGAEPGWFVLATYLQAPLLIAAAIYVLLARRLGLFAPDEGPDGPPKESSKASG